MSAIREETFKVHAWQYFGIFLLLIFACCMLGTAARAFNPLAAFWPANAVLLGALTRFPRTRNPYTLAGSVAGYLLADLVSAMPPMAALGLTVANLMYVLVVWGFYLKFRKYFRVLHQGYFYLFLLLFCCMGSFVSSLLIASMLPHLNQPLFHGSFWLRFGFWFSAELQNTILILPLILNFPYQKRLVDIFALPQGSIPILHILPVIVLLVSLLLSRYDVGPGALLYPVAALIWCALSYRHFNVALITALSCLYIIFYVSVTDPTLYPQDYYLNLISLRMGIIAMAIAPLTVSSINRIRSQLIRELQHSVAHDELTASLTRRQFMHSANLLLRQRMKQQNTLTVLMLDIDHFKSINDRYGHQAGDLALKTCAQIIRQNLRSYDLFGRLGGEEFAIVLLDVTAEEAYPIAERIRISLKQQVIQPDPHTRFSFQISIGCAQLDPQHPQNLDALLHQADQALYQAKRNGRDQVVIAT